MMENKAEHRLCHIIKVLGNVLAIFITTDDQHPLS